jgi:integrase
MRAWLDASGIGAGAAFRSISRHGRIQSRLSKWAVAVLVKQHAGAAGLDRASVPGHSLRAGLCTSAAAAGVAERVIQLQSGHRSTAMLRRYIRAGSLWTENAAGRVGL